jgi:hypothetical protein
VVRMPRTSSSPWTSVIAAMVAQRSQCVYSGCLRRPNQKSHSPIIAK